MTACGTDAMAPPGCCRVGLLYSYKSRNQRGRYSFGVLRMPFSMRQHPKQSSALPNTLWGTKLVSRSLFKWRVDYFREYRVGAKCCMNTFNLPLSLTGLPRKGLAKLRPHALWGVCLSRADAAAPPGMVSRCCVGCWASGSRSFLSWGAVSPCCTGSPRPSWKWRADIQHQPETFLRLPSPP